jgi:hypothetical protein
MNMRPDFTLLHDHKAKRGVESLGPSITCTANATVVGQRQSKFIILKGPTTLIAGACGRVQKDGRRQCVIAESRRRNAPS